MQVNVEDAEDLLTDHGVLIFYINNRIYKAFAQGQWDHVTLCRQPESGNAIPNPLEMDMSIKRSILKDG